MNRIEPTFFRHTKRPAWGLAIRTGTSSSGLQFQFEDGRLRTIANGYADRLMEEVDRPADAGGRFDELTRKLGVSQVLAVDADGTERVTIEGQVAVFAETYPKKFRDPKWLGQVRGVDAKRRTKKLREPAIGQARQVLSRERMERLIEEGLAGTLWLGFVEVMRGTDLVGKEVRALEKVRPTSQGHLVRKLYELLHGTGELATRFNAFVGELREAGVKPTWPLVTAPLALVHPDQHIVVRPVPFRRQAKSTAPRLKLNNQPLGRTYEEALGMAVAVERDLRRLGHAPQDLLAIYDFIVLTTKKGRSVGAPTEKLASGRPEGRPAASQRALGNVEASIAHP